MNWSVLGIEETKDKKAITAAYRKRVTQVNPVDKPVETHSVSEMTDTDIYYAVDLRLKPSGRPREETFEAGYGVWRIGYRVVKEKTLWERDLISVAVAYQNGKLAMVYSLTNSYGNNAGGWESQRPCSFWVAVYDEDGLEYAADYRVSLGISEYELGAERDNICEIRDDVEIGISFKNNNPSGNIK